MKLGETKKCKANAHCTNEFRRISLFQQRCNIQLTRNAHEFPYFIFKCFFFAVSHVKLSDINSSGLGFFSTSGMFRFGFVYIDRVLFIFQYCSLSTHPFKNKNIYTNFAGFEQTLHLLPDGVNLILDFWFLFIQDGQDNEVAN